MTTGSIETWRMPTGSMLQSGSLEGLLLLLLATGGPCDVRDLLNAGGVILNQTLDVSSLDLLITTGLAVHTQGNLRLSGDQTARELVVRTLPSQVATAHAAWAQVLVADRLGRARHEALACIGPNGCAAGQAASAAVQLQRLGRSGLAIEMFEQAARLSGPGAARVDLLTQAAAVAYAAGQPNRGHELAEEALRLVAGENPAPVLTLLEATFRGSDEETGIPWSQHVTAAAQLCTRGQFAAAFAVLAASPVQRWDEQQLGNRSDGDGPPAERAIVGLALLREGRMSTALPLLQSAAARMDTLGEYGAAAAAFAIVGEVAACLGQVWAATRALSRAEPIEAVELTSRKRWCEAYDVLVGLVDRPGGPRPELVAWGLLSHFADAAVHSGRIADARRLVSRSAEVEGVFEYDATLADLMYATAVLSDTAHADACFEVLLSHNPSRWPWLRGRAHLAYGEHLRRERHVAAARPHLIAARRLFEAMGATAWERRAEVELRAAGICDDVTGSTQLVDVPLSAQELQIAEMAAKGLTNRQIGHALYLSPRTVGSHLYRIFPKLQITSRNQLAAFLAR